MPVLRSPTVRPQPAQRSPLAVDWPPSGWRAVPFAWVCCAMGVAWRCVNWFCGAGPLPQAAREVSVDSNRVPKAFLVMRYEISSVGRTKSFVLATFGLPLVVALIFFLISLLGANSPAAPSLTPVPTAESSLRVEGYVDPGGLIRAIGPDVPDGVLVPYSDQASARQALEAGSIAAYYVIPADYLGSGDLIYVNPGYVPRSENGQTWVMRHTIFANLLGNDLERLARASTPMDLQVTTLSPQKLEPDDHPAPFYIPYATMMILYLAILMNASLLLNSVSNEKKDRVMEILLLSVAPRQMLAGKIVGLGLLGLLQTAIWLGTGYGLLRLGGGSLGLPAGLELPPSILAWGPIFFLLGYAVYASLMAGLGALVPNLREASQAVIIVIWPLLIPMFLLPALIKESQGTLATALSIFPLTAPVAMMPRLATGRPPLWQPASAALLMVITAVVVIRAVSAMFRARNLLSGQPFSARRFLQQLCAPGRG